MGALNVRVLDRVKIETDDPRELTLGKGSAKFPARNLQS